MTSLLDNKCEKWIDEKGDSVIMVPSPFGGIFYVDQGSKILNVKYNPHFKNQKVQELGSAGLEDFADKILSFFPIMEGFGGFEEKGLKSFEEVYQCTSYTAHLLTKSYLRYKEVMGRKCLFPTEDLVKKCFDLWESYRMIS